MSLILAAKPISVYHRRFFFSRQQHALPGSPISDGGLSSFSFIAPYLGDLVVSEIACVGSVILVALGFKLMGAIKVDIMNFVPGVFLPILLCPLIG